MRLQDAQRLHDVSSALSHHIRHEALVMPSLTCCLSVLHDLRARAAQPLAAPGKRGRRCLRLYVCVAAMVQREVSPGLVLETVDSFVRISATNAAVAEAGAHVGDGLFEIGDANVLGLCAREAVQLLVGCAGSNGLLPSCLVNLP
jgi:hypothetical protein